MSQTRRRLRDYRINLQNPALCVTLKTAGEISPKSMAIHLNVGCGNLFENALFLMLRKTR